MEIPQELVEQLARGNCVAFVGAGLSQAASLPSWEQLLRTLVEEAANQGVLGNERTELEQLIAKHEYLLVAEELRELLGKPKFQEFIAECFDQPGLKPADVHEALVTLPFSALLTSNYDRLLESAVTLARSGEIPPSFTYTDTGELAQFLFSGRFYILHTHGYVDRRDTIVLSTADYRDAMFSHPDYRNHLRAVFSTKIVLFLGFSLEDPDIDLLLNELQATYQGYGAQRYALLPEGSVNSIKAKRFFKDRNIRVLTYPAPGANHEAVPRFLRQLFERIRQSAPEVASTTDGAAFTWDVCATGYQWVETRTVSIQDPIGTAVEVLTEQVPVGTQFMVNRYYPLASAPNLFRIFGALEPIRESFQVFANEYGPLGGRAQVTVRLPLAADQPAAVVVQESTSQERFTMGVGDTLKAWHEEVGAMRELLGIWDMARQRDTTRLAGYFHWHGAHAVTFRNPPGDSPEEAIDPESLNYVHVAVVASKVISPQLFESLTPGDFIRPALFFVMQEVNKRLDGLTSVRLLWNVQESRIQLYRIPNCLLGAIWLQLAQEIDGVGA